jgi:hypothetical protein
VRKLLMALLAALVALPAAAIAKDKDYAGQDAGYLVYSVGNVRGVGLDFSFSYGRTPTLDGAPATDWKGKIEPRLGGAIYLKIKNPDFVGEESGHVIVRRLPPGRYVVNGFYFGGFVPGVGSFAWSPSRPFALPFVIRSGEATYIGSFMRSVSLGTPLQPILGASGFFVVADRSDRDLPLARSRLPADTRIAVEVTDVSAFGSEILRTSMP